MLVERARTLKLGNGLDESVHVGPWSARRSAKRPPIRSAERRRRLVLGGEFYTRRVRGGWFAHHLRRRDARCIGAGDLAPCCRCWTRGIWTTRRDGNDTTGLSSSIYTRDVNHAFGPSRHEAGSPM
jgi:acyl-CoA reductase-like NAD-dependent aldehyde dehydrogenase